MLTLDQITRVKMASIAFLHKFARINAIAEDTTRNLLERITDLLGTNSLDDQNERCLSYDVIGLLLKNNQVYARQHVEILTYLFTALGKEPAIVQNSIQSALAGLDTAYRDLPDDVANTLSNLLMRVVTKGTAIGVASALRLCRESFSFDHIASRWTFILASKYDTYTDIKKEVEIGLKPEDTILPTAPIPATQHPFHSPTMLGLLEWAQAHLQETTGNALEYQDANILTVFIKFARQLFFLEAAKNQAQQHVVDGSDISDRYRHDHDLRKAIRDGASQMFHLDWQRDLIEQFASFLMKVLLDTNMEPAGLFLFELLTFRPQLQASLLSAVSAVKAAYDKTPVWSTKCFLADLYGLIATGDNLTAGELVNELIVAECPDKLWTISICRHLVLSDRRNCLPELLLKELNDTLLQSMSARKETDWPGVLRDLEMATILATVFLLDAEVFRSRLKSYLKRADLFAGAIRVLGLLATNPKIEAYPRLPFIDAILEMNEPHINTIDAAIAIGEFLGNVLGMQRSQSFLNLLWYSEKVQQHGYSSVREPEGMSVMSPVLNKISNEFLRSSNKDRRLVGVILLHNLLYQLGHLCLSGDHLSRIHKDFLLLLVDRDDFIASLALQGISRCYDLSESRYKHDLVTALLTSFPAEHQGREERSTTPGDSVLGSVVEPAQETTANSGRTVRLRPSLMIIKELCSLAFDFGNNDLVYWLLAILSAAIAENDAKLNFSLKISTRGSSNTSVTIARQPDQTLKRLLPKLFRCQFDPDTGISSAVMSINTALFKDLNACITQTLDSVISELLKCFADRNLSKRVASIRAFCSLIGARGFAVPDEFQHATWSVGLRVLDDVSEVVRTEAKHLCAILAQVLIKSSTLTTAGAQSQVITAIPILEQALSSASEDVSSFALSTLLKVIESSPVSIGSYLPALIEKFLVLTSTAEPQILNYISFHAAKYKLTQAELDQARITAMGTSSLMSGLDRCVDLINESVVGSVVAILAQVLRQNHGLPTQAATSRFIVSLCSRSPDLLTPHADTLLQAMSSNLSSTNEMSLNLNASAIGYLARIASTAKLQKLHAFLLRKFFANLQDQVVDPMALCLLAISRSAPERFAGLQSLYAPIVFLGKQGTTTSSTIYQTIWDEYPSPSAAVRLHLQETVDVIESQLSSPVWAVRELCALSLAKLVSIAHVGPLQAKITDLCLVKLEGRLWSGKENLLSTLIQMSNDPRLSLDQQQQESIQRALFREAREKSSKYKLLVLPLLTQWLDRHTDREVFAEVHELVHEAMVACQQNSSQTSDYMRLAVPCLAAAYQRNINEFDSIVMLFNQISSTSDWNIKVLICTALEKVLAGTETTTLRPNSVTAIWNLLHQYLLDQSHQTLRESAFRTIATLLTASRSNELLASLVLQMENALRALRNDEKNRVILAGLESLL